MKKEMQEELTLHEKLESERRGCTLCGLAVQNPFIERCPRCFGLLPHLEVSCQGCFHKKACPIADQARV